MTTDTAWPYDARRDDPLTALRIPAVGTLCPNHTYLVAVCINENPETMLWYGERPDEHEVALVRAFLDWRLSHYSDTWRANHMSNRPFDVDNTAAGITLLKRGENDWAYVVDTWRQAIPVPETWQGKEKPLTLSGLLDRLNGWGDKPNPAWETFKADRPEIFGTPA